MMLGPDIQSGLHNCTRWTPATLTFLTEALTGLSPFLRVEYLMTYKYLTSSTLSTLFTAWCQRCFVHVLYVTTTYPGTIRQSKCQHALQLILIIH